jgi:hypothetical protein
MCSAFNAREPILRLQNLQLQRQRYIILQAETIALVHAAACTLYM